MQHLLFICSRNQWRSRTAETIFRGSPGIEVKSAGTAAAARVRITRAMLDWADAIYLMERKHLAQLQSRFGRDDWVDRVTILDIPDEYRYMDAELVEELRDSVPH